MALFTLPFMHPVEFFIALGIGGAFVAIFQMSALAGEIIAVIAYLQRLGKDIKPSAAAAASSGGEPPLASAPLVTAGVR